MYSLEHDQTTTGQPLMGRWAFLSLHPARRYQLCRTMQLLARDGGPTLPCPCPCHCHCLYHCALAGEGPSQVSTTHEHHHGLKREPRPWVCAWPSITKVTDINMAPSHIRTTNPLIPLSGYVGYEPPHNLPWLHIPVLRYQTSNVWINLENIPSWKNIIKRI